MAGGRPPRVDATALNDLLIQRLASRLPQTERQHTLAWACRLREEERLSSLQLLLGALLQAASSGGPVGRPFAAPVPSDRELPPMQDLSAECEARPAVGVLADLEWARSAVREYSRLPTPGLFLGMHPKPRAGTMCYMSVFGA